MQTGCPELSSAQSYPSFPPKRCQKLFHSRPPSRGRRAQSSYNRLRFASRTFHVFIHYAKIIILAQSRDLIVGLRQPPGDLFIWVLAPAAQPSLQFFARGRQDKNGHRFWHLFLYLRRALHVNLENQIESPSPRFLQPLLRRAVGVFSEDPRILQKFAARDHGVEFRFSDKIIALPAGLGRAARPCST